ncbi:hypothetical protein BJX99DRAFT_258691 [Aspergillus californicus]
MAFALEPDEQGMMPPISLGPLVFERNPETLMENHILPGNWVRHPPLPEPVTPPQILHNCVACGEETALEDLATVPCGHEYCRTCSQRFFEVAMTDDSLFPPRCCRKPLDDSVALIFLPREFIERYEKKKLEFDNPDEMYCCVPTCSAFIHPSRLHHNLGSCPACGVNTCSLCSKQEHTHNCQEDPDDKEVLAMARAEGWKRCPSCRRMVERVTGCNSMRCMCGQHFCYGCGSSPCTCFNRAQPGFGMARRAHTLFPAPIAPQDEGARLFGHFHRHRMLDADWRTRAAALLQVPRASIGVAARELADRLEEALATLDSDPHQPAALFAEYLALIQEFHVLAREERRIRVDDVSQELPFAMRDYVRRTAHEVISTPVTRRYQEWEVQRLAERMDERMAQGRVAATVHMTRNSGY